MLIPFRHLHVLGVTALEPTVTSWNLSDGLIGVFGRLHPAVLHLPIGMLVALLLLELLGALRRRPLAREVRIPLAWLTALSAILAAGTGYVLALEPGYGTVTVDRHRLLGIAFAVGCLLVALLSFFDRWPRLRWGVLLLTAILMIPTGHLGAATTHGDDFMWAPLSKARRSPEAPPPSPPAAPTSPAPAAGPPPGPPPALPATSASVEASAARPTFEHDVLPVLSQYCIECHGESKAKGRLRLHTLAALSKGGADGAVVIPGDTEASELLRRMRLPLDDPDRMPPADMEQPSDRQIEVIAEWIAQGAGGPDGADGGGGARREPALPAAPAGATSSAPGAARALPRSAPADPAPPADPEAIRALLDALVHVQRLGAEDHGLAVDFTGAKALDDAGMATLLEPLRESIVDLSLSRTSAGPATMAVVGRMPRLERLDVRATSMGDGAFAQSRGAQVSELLLSQTGVGDASVEVLASMPNLRRVHAWRSGLGESGIKALTAARPEVEVLLGEVITAAVLEQEAPVTVAKAAPPAAASASAPAATASAAPVNSACPVTGSPIDPRFVILHEGQAVGFCCPNCPKEFWANPQKYTAALPSPAKRERVPRSGG